jgi:hypothetical protein
VAVCANVAILATRGEHHRFLESIKAVGLEGDVSVFIILLGS